MELTVPPALPQKQRLEPTHVDSLFATPDLAVGYAKARPPVHSRIISRVLENSRQFAPCPIALDLGCGAGLSTAALAPLAIRRIGIEPAHPMLLFAALAVPDAQFVAARAEQLPFADGFFSLVSAAGSLNYMDALSLALREVSRVLRSGGLFIAYDFLPGRRCNEAPQLEIWYEQFLDRYPKARDGARFLDPSSIASMSPSFAPTWQEQFDVQLPITRESYVDYMMTETNVAFAVREGAIREQVREWCLKTLDEVFQNRVLQVAFEAYVIVLSKCA